MFCVIYSFDVHEGQDEKFIQAWAGLTKLIYQYEGSLGSRLHQESEHRYLAYAQWPNRKRWEDSGDQMPEEADQFRKDMKDSCSKIETLHTMELSEDLLQSTIWEG